MKINHYYKLDIKQHKFRLQYLKYQIHLTFVETMEINGGIFSKIRPPNYCYPSSILIQTLLSI